MNFCRHAVSDAICDVPAANSGADTIGYGGARAPYFYKWLGTAGTLSRRTANKILTKRYWPSGKRSPKRLIVLVEPKSGGHDQKIFQRFAPDRCPHFQIRSDDTGCRDSFHSCHCCHWAEVSLFHVELHRSWFQAPAKDIFVRTVSSTPSALGEGEFPAMRCTNLHIDIDGGTPSRSRFKPLFGVWC